MTTTSLARSRARASLLRRAREMPVCCWIDRSIDGWKVQLTVAARARARGEAWTASCWNAGWCRCGKRRLVAGAFARDSTYTRVRGGLYVQWCVRLLVCVYAVAVAAATALFLSLSLFSFLFFLEENVPFVA